MINPKSAFSASIIFLTFFVSRAEAQQGSSSSAAPPAIHQPKLVNPEKFRVESGQRGQKSRENTSQRDNNDLVDRLKTPRLRNGIGAQPFQRTIYNRAAQLPSLNHSFLASAYLAPEPHASKWLNRTWESPNMAHRPLHFEDENLERYGNNQKFQTFRSGVHFFKSHVFLPYSIGKYGNECQFSMGYYRPGDCNPAYLPDTTKSARGAFYQAIAFGLIAMGID